MAELKSKYEIVIERLKAQGLVSTIEESIKDKIVSTVEKELDDYRFENQKRIRESQEQIATVVLTA
jgi:hypothetical protein